MLNYDELQEEVKRRATWDQSGTEFDDAIKRSINHALFRVSREGFWRQLRRKETFDTVTSYTEGSGAVAVTDDSSAVTVTGATFITDNVKVGRKIKISGSSKYYTIDTITGETTLTLTRAFDGTTSTTATYEILPQEEYNLPIQTDHRTFVWHEEYGYPYRLDYITDFDFYNNSVYNTTKGVPTHYRMWGVNMVEEQPLEASVLTVQSSAAADTSIPITVFGIVSGYPDQETITTNAADGTTGVAGSKSFTSVERIVKNGSTTGRVTITSNTANVTVATIPTGNATSGVYYSKLQIYPLPDTVFPIQVQYYKQPYALVNDNDVHELGQEFDECIILLAVSRLKAEQNQDTATAFYSMYQDELRSLKKRNIDKTDWFPKLLRQTNGRGDIALNNNLLYRQIGGNYGPASRF